jgi:hypothetical protein
MIDLQGTPLWRAFARRANDGQREMVRVLTTRAADRLDRVVETLPTYTLHNRVHALNVVERMGDLLGARVDDVTAVEGALLILSAYHHDIGMVFTPEERAAIREERWFPQFLDRHPDAFLAVEAASGDLPIEIAEWYCRWRHADRVTVYLDGLPPESLGWGVVSLKDWLAVVCRSHNQDHTVLRDDVVYKTDLLVGGDRSDLRMCAVLLRLADILDFDNSRSPDGVYEHLGLGRRQTSRETHSDVEWRKHLASEGFTFPKDPKERQAPYLLGYSAAPQRPAVEHDLREFLDVIEGELGRSAGVLGSCSPRWRDLVLPDRIDRSNIHSQGYKYGPYRFDLDRHQVLELFMGENLYESPYSFVRELLQNAIDASRHRRFYERSRGDDRFEPAPIRVSEWRDEDHRHWVRFDDFGMGMSEEIVREFFLKVGESYYSSSSFRAEVLRSQSKESREFVPISRFGIGVLSCFVVGDQVEVSTLRAGPGDAGQPAIRLSLPGLESFYTLQVEGEMSAEPMPAPDGKEPGYRALPGTSVAVRIDARKEAGQLNLREVIEKYVFAPPVSVEFEHEHLGGDPSVLVDRPWLAPRTVPLEPEEQSMIEATVGRELPDPVTLRILPLDLTKASPHPEVAGQLVAVFPSGGEALRRALQPGAALRAIELEDVKTVGLSRYGYDWENREITLEYDRVVRGPWGPEEALRTIKAALESVRDTAERAELTRALEHVRRRLTEAEEGHHDRPSLSMTDRLRAVKVPDAVGPLSPRPIILSHNGVRVPDLSWTVPGVACETPDGTTGFLFGCVQLSDRLRPDVSISRDTLRGVAWNIHSAVTLALLRALDQAGEDLAAWSLNDLLQLPPSAEELGVMLDDPLFLREDGWLSIPIIDVGTGRRSILQMRQAVASGKRIVLPEIQTMELLGSTTYAAGSSYFLLLCAQGLLQTNLQLAWVRDGHSANWSCVVHSADPPALPEGLRLFPPLFFVPYEGSRLLREGFRALNLHHPFSQWLVQAAPSLRRTYPELLSALREALSQSFLDSADETATHVNAILDRLRQLEPAGPLPRIAYLKAVDLGWD